jgi:DNA polymerase beta thumb
MDTPTSQPNTKNSVIYKIIQKLHSTGHITDDLDPHIERYEGIAQLPSSIFSDSSIPQPPHRRIIFRLVPWDAFVFSQLHFTGTEFLIRHLREQAARLGYRLSSYGLEKRTHTKVEVFGVDALRLIDQDSSDTRKEGEYVLLDSEEDVFRFLKVNYIPPMERNWY